MNRKCTDIVTDHTTGDVICRYCGLVQQDHIFYEYSLQFMDYSPPDQDERTIRRMINDLRSEYHPTNETDDTIFNVFEGMKHHLNIKKPKYHALLAATYVAFRQLGIYSAPLRIAIIKNRKAGKFVRLSSIFNTVA